MDGYKGRQKTEIGYEGKGRRYDGEIAIKQEIKGSEQKKKQMRRAFQRMNSKIKKDKKENRNSKMECSRKGERI